MQRVSKTELSKILDGAKKTEEAQSYTFYSLAFDLRDLRELTRKYFLERDKVMLSLDDEPDTREYAKAENALRKAVKQ